MDLIIDTSSEKLKLILNNDMSFIESEESNQKHLKNLLPEIENVLVKSKKELKDIDVFSVVVGPGSFTGVRIGVSTIKAFGCVLGNKRYIAINMLNLLANTIILKQKVNTNFCIVIKSTSTKYYFGLADCKANVKEMKLVTLEELQSYVQNNAIPIFSYNCNKIDNINNFDILLTTQDYITYNELLKSKKQFVSISEIKPVYLALSQAEEELNKRLANENNNN